MVVNESSKARLEKLNNALINNLESTLGIKVYQDSVSEDEFKVELKGVYHYIIFETGGMRRADDKKFTLLQDVLIRFYAENVDDLDGTQLDVITTLESCGYQFVSSDKGYVQKGQEDAYVDSIEFNFTRSLKYGI
ncbi:hypothetical protein G4D61_11100 [Bacillus ginsengihumi]|uniref:Uncharacterized protein n=1 Tax=Heyndrickxia ginsengihumi TaxID=363870 RepID=A0A6M0P723_9BACI|nr:hypothetical protein [Heyndrickxia ginsengihumi]